ncbi:shikimate dehydrogenase [Ornithinibacillus salinisoli]|uniref:Shikimate dehydrogenase (NADP(+)) n=1 Tax=Ornithinibacillus salinisoli TaxID=1848459 RepID=A0ABW4W3T1_9BACI
MNYRLGLIGYPIEHSLSPWIHNQFLEKTSLNGNYSAYEIAPQEFEQNIKDFFSLDLLGFNVTIPYKQKIIPYLDELDEYAAQIGAVNTVKNKDGKWIGYNTDGQGYIRSLKGKFPMLFSDNNRRILLIGAGGAARSIYYALVTEGFLNIDITNRTLEHARDIKGMKSGLTTTEVLSIPDAERNLDQYDLIIQTTNVGMSPEKDVSIVMLNHVNPSTIISDIVYRPILTNMLEQAKVKGAYLHYGHTMLLYQAQYAFEIWTNKKVVVEGMEEQLKTILEGKHYVNR